MYENKQEEQTAVLAAIDTGEYDAQRSMDELEELAKSAGAKVMGRVIQKKDRPDPATLMGSGRVEELAEFVQNSQVELVIFDHELSPAQQKNLENALVHSDNIYFAKAACAMGTDGFTKSLKSLGFGETLPFDFSATASSFGSDGKIGSETELADSGYGQGKILVNPIHLSSIYSALVNEGNMVKPYLLDGESASYWKEGVFTGAAADTVLADLYQVVENSEGTAQSARRDGFRMAGKTGTAELKTSKEDTAGQELGWFVGICAEDTGKPLMITMMIEDVKGRGGSHYVIPKVMKGFDEWMK